MTTFFILGLLLLTYILVMQRRPLMPKQPGDWMYKTIQNNINEYFDKHICRQVTVAPVGFIFDEHPPESQQHVPTSFIVVAKVKVNGKDKEFTVLVGDMSPESSKLASDTIIKKIREEIDILQVTGC